MGQFFQEREFNGAFRWWGEYPLRDLIATDVTIAVQNLVTPSRSNRVYDIRLLQHVVTDAVCVDQEHSQVLETLGYERFATSNPTGDTNYKHGVALG